MGDRVRGAILLERFEIIEHCKLPASTEKQAGTAVGSNLFRQPDMRHNRKPEPREIRWLMRKRAQTIEELPPRLLSQFFGQASADAVATMASIDNKRSDLGQRVAQRRQLSARDDLRAMNRDQKAADMASQLVQLTRQKPPLLEMRFNEPVNLPCLFEPSRSNHHRPRLALFSSPQLSDSHGVTPAST
jgi:hypothetical protein